jgi:hypothetical protein
MTNRRGAFIAIAVAALGGVAWFFSGSRRAREQSVVHAGIAETPQDPVERLRADLERLSGRVYSEEGIPMFLACEDLAADQTSPHAPFKATALNRDLASAFRRDSDAWLRIHPEAPVAEVAKILEVLADRDFASGGAEKTL